MHRNQRLKRFNYDLFMCKISSVTDYVKSCVISCTNIMCKQLRGNIKFYQNLSLENIVYDFLKVNSRFINDEL